MEYAEYIAEYRKFDAEFFPDASLEEVEDKLLEEMKELYAEIELGNSLENRIAETTDVMNMAIKLLTRYGVKDPLDAGAAKIRLTAEKYRAQVKYKLQSSGLSDRK